MKQAKLWMLAAILTICGACITTCCTSSDDRSAEGRSQGDNPVVETQQPTIQRIKERSKLLVGTTGDYRPLSYREADGNYWGFGIEMAEKIAERIGVGIAFVQTSWINKKAGEF